jgi:acyl dehydratase
MAGLLTADLRAKVGTEVEYVSPEPLGSAAIRYFATAIGDANPIYLDSDAAQRAGHVSVIAPPTLVCETNQTINRPRDDDGYAGHVWDLEIPGADPIRGGNRYEFHQAVLPTDRITTRWRLVEMNERTTSGGAALLFVISEARYFNQHSELLSVNRETIIYKQVANGD